MLLQDNVDPQAEGGSCTEVNLHMTHMIYTWKAKYTLQYSQIFNCYCLCLFLPYYTFLCSYKPQLGQSNVLHQWIWAWIYTVYAHIIGTGHVWHYSNPLHTEFLGERCNPREKMTCWSKSCKRKGYSQLALGVGYSVAVRRYTVVWIIPTTMT